jgi:hypothetical protein
MFSFIRRSMIARLIALGAVGLVTMGVEKGCVFGTSDEDDDPIDNVDDGSGNGTTFETRLVLRDSSGSQTTLFEPNELITLELSVRNKTAVEQTIDLPSTLVHEFYVFDDNEETALWVSSDDQTVNPVVTPLEFAANETKVMSFTWNQGLADGTFLASGVYDVRGLVAAEDVSADPDEPHELRSVLRGFEID